MAAAGEEEAVSKSSKQYRSWVVRSGAPQPGAVQRIAVEGEFPATIASRQLDTLIRERQVADGDLVVVVDDTVGRAYSGPSATCWVWRVQVSLMPTWPDPHTAAYVQQHGTALEKQLLDALVKARREAAPGLTRQARLVEPDGSGGAGVAGEWRPVGIGVDV